VPVIAKQVVGWVPHCAVASHRDSLKLFCAGCFKEGMTLADDSRCRTCSGFVKHWMTKNGERNWKCKPAKETIQEVAKACSEVVLDFGGSDISGWKTDDLTMELKHRNASKVHCAKSYRPFELFVDENCKLQNEAKMNVTFERGSARDPRRSPLSAVLNNASA